jgi:hypothetical protein
LAFHSGGGVTLGRDGIGGLKQVWPPRGPGEDLVFGAAVFLTCGRSCSGVFVNAVGQAPGARSKVMSVDNGAE